MKVFVDANVFIRFFTRDSEKEYLQCVDLFNSIEQGTLRPYTSNIVLLEVCFVLSRLYKYEDADVIFAMNEILSLRNITLIETTDTPGAIMSMQQYHIKYADCLIATQVPEGATLVTYDRDFKKIPDITIGTPADVLQAIQA